MSSIRKLIEGEVNRQKNTLMMIPSENYTYPEVREAVGSALMHKYSEGYPNARYYQGNEFVDKIELLAIDNAKKLFQTPHANVQAYSGSPANTSVYMALADPGEVIMGMKLAVGGHLTHGHPDITFSGKYYKSVQFGVGENGKLDYGEISELAKKIRPKVMLIGTTSYPLAFDWKKFYEIADSVGAWLVADISHVVGLVIADAYPSPVEYCHVITTTTHKSLRGPRGAIILATQKGVGKDPDLPKLIDRAIFPGLQGGPHNNTTAGIAIALEKASTPEFREYGKQILVNAKALSNKFIDLGLNLYAGGTESHLLVLDFVEIGLSGNIVAEALEAAGIIANRNSVPNDPMPPFYPSGLRLGTPAVTVRGMKEDQMLIIANWIAEIIDYVKNEKLPHEPSERSIFVKEFRRKMVNDSFLSDIRNKVERLCDEFPIPGM